MPGFRKMTPAPKIALTRFGAGVHSFWESGKGFARGNRAFGATHVERRGRRWIFRRITVKREASALLLPLPIEFLDWFDTRQLVASSFFSASSSISR